MPRQPRPRGGAQRTHRMKSGMNLGCGAAKGPSGRGGAASSECLGARLCQPAAGTHVVREVRIHEEDEAATGPLQPVPVGAAEAQLARPLQDQDTILSDRVLQRPGHLVRAVGAVVLHHDDLVVDVAARPARQRPRAPVPRAREHFAATRRPRCGKAGTRRPRALQSRRRWPRSAPRTHFFSNTSTSSIVIKGKFSLSL